MPGEEKVLIDAGPENWLPSEYCTLVPLMKPSGSEDVAVHPRTVVGYMLGIGATVIWATGGMLLGSAITFKEALAVGLPALSNDWTIILCEPENTLRAVLMVSPCAA